MKYAKEWVLFPPSCNYEGADKGILEMLVLTLLSHWSHWSNGRSHLLDFSVCDFLKCPICLICSVSGFLLLAAKSILIDTIINVFWTHISHNVIRCVAKKESIYTHLCFRNTTFDSVRHVFLRQDCLGTLHWEPPSEEPNVYRVL